MTMPTRAVLAAIRDADGKPIHGLLICQAANLSSGTVYPILDRLGKAGLVESAWEGEDEWRGDETRRPRRRYYTLTAAGVEAAETAPREAAHLSAASAEVPVRIFRAAWKATSRDFAPVNQVRRALAAAFPLIEQDLRTRLADALDAFADAQYPETVFTPGSAQPDGVAGTAMRHAYHQAARLIRDGWPDNEDHS
jgi:PadR family transcriptional regulator PadR